MENTFVILTDRGAWGKAPTLSQAFKNAMFKGTESFDGYAINCKPEEVTIRDFQVHYPKECVAIQIGPGYGSKESLELDLVHLVEVAVEKVEDAGIDPGDFFRRNGKDEFTDALSEILHPEE